MSEQKNAGANKRLAKIVAKARSRRAWAKEAGINHVVLGRIERGAKITYAMSKRLEVATGIPWDRWVQE